MSAARPLVGAAIAALVSACVPSAGPTSWLPTPEQAATSGFGGWVEATLHDRTTVQGELIAVAPDTLWVFARDRVRIVARAQLVQGRVIAYDSRATELLGWSTLGSLATISNGYFLLLTAPMWWIAGGITTHHQAHEPVLTLLTEWSALPKYARFPAGLPPGLRLEDLKPKPANVTGRK